MFKSLPRSLALAVLMGVSATLLGCKPGEGANDASNVSGLRSVASDSTNPKLVATWLLAELFEPGGDQARAKEARRRLDSLGAHGMLADLARGLDDEFHGRLAQAPEHFLQAAKAARLTTEADSDLVAEFALRQAIALESNTQNLFARWEAWVNEAMEDPRHLGFGARDQLVRWWTAEAWEVAAKDIETRAMARLGCFDAVRLAGPFGMGAQADILRSFDAERVDPWPERFAPDPQWGHSPRVLETDQNGCSISVDEAVGNGVFYAETFFEVEQPMEAVLFVDSAQSVWVDGVAVFERDSREWGSWTKVATGLSIPPGRHRVLARLLSPQTSIRLVAPDGKPLAVRSSSNNTLLYGIHPVQLVADPSPLRRYVSAQGVGAPPAPWLRYVAAELAQIEGEPEVAAMLIEPLIKDPEKATGPALAAAASYVEGDPIFDASQTADMMRELHRKALKRDPELWVSELSFVSQLGRSRGVTEAMPAFKRLTERYQQVPALLGALASVYGELGWTPEYRATVKLRAERFPEDPEGLYAAAQVLNEEGQREQADALYERIRKLDPDSTVFVGLALERRDYDTAIAELERLQTRRPKRHDLQSRIEEIELHRGRSQGFLPALERQLKEEPRDSKLRLQLADARYAAGDSNALRSAIADAVQAGANPGPIKEALDLVDGLTELEPYRLDAKQIIAEYEASNRELPGTAARVLDYMAAWVRADGSSRLLEHELIRIQSEEAIGRFAEHAVRGDIVLQMRVIKKDGQILEPEPVPGKPTVTFPHLEVGDYIETEQIYAHDGSPGGAYYDGPHWFFREQGVAYARSEFVLIAPTHQVIDVETTGAAPEPMVQERGYFTERRWRADFTPPAPTEPMSVPISEYLPSIRISWGLNLERRLELLTSQVTATTPVDPRIVRIAKNIVGTIPKHKEVDRARHLYRWVLRNVQEGEEDDGRRVVTGKRGSPWRAFETLCRALGIEVAWAVAKDRLAPTPSGPDMRARQFNTTVLRIGNRKPMWLTFDGRFKPFGYLPASVRGMPAYLLHADQAEKVILPTAGTKDGVVFDVDAKLAADGSATLRITQRYEGALASSLREAFDELPGPRIHDVLEERLLTNAFPGARLMRYELEALDDLDAPLTIVLEGETAQFARREGQRLLVAPPYSPRLSQLSTLPTRQTAILIGAERRQGVNVNIQLPSGARVQAHPEVQLSFQSFQVAVDDVVSGSTLKLQRKIVVPATRIAPDAYSDFLSFTQGAEAALNRDVVIEL